MTPKSLDDLIGTFAPVDNETANDGAQPTNEQPDNTDKRYTVIVSEDVKRLVKVEAAMAGITQTEWADAALKFAAENMTLNTDS